MSNKVLITNSQKAVKVPSGLRILIRRACNAVLEYEHFEAPAEISVTFVDNAAIAELNNQYRNKPMPTDVLSFPLGVDGKYDVDENNGCKMLGDIVISMERAQEQATLYGHPLQREVAFLTVHSMLHLLGYDHENGGLEAMRMREKEEAVLTQLGLPRTVSYTERSQISAKDRSSILKNAAPMQQHYDTSSVFVAVIGRPNVGKSSLTNRLVGEKVAIVTSKPQTTRTRITGVVTRGPLQYVLLDTPGVHKAHNKLGKRMDKTASDSIADVDVSMMLFEPYGALNEPEMVLVDALRSSGGPAIAVINKTDLVKEPADLEARKAELKELGVFDAIYTVSVRADDHCEELFDALSQYAVEGPHYFDDDAYTDMPEKELVAEVIREKALLYMRDEIPHGIAVVVERFKERPGTDLVDIDVNIYCERESHKGMVIGKGGAMLKKIASSARADCEEFLGCRVNLQCWVKVKADWRDNEFLLNNFGFKQNPNNR